MSEQTTTEDAATTESEEEAPLTQDSQETDRGADSGSDEGDIAADYLEELLDIVDLDGDIEIEIRGERTFISIQAEEDPDDLQRLVGTKGEVLDALQELTRLAVLTSTGERTRLVLDINGYRAARNDELRQLAQDAVAEVRQTGEKVHLEPMSAFERKIVHDFLAEADLASESEGEGKRRHVVASAE
ncbi:hypothetical protein GCM10023354_12800 [Garicola koreensis]|uniref:Jag family protein n=1 Tax=Garicola koreensis TaxID=1262554 RepID=UPI0031E6BE80